MKIGPPLPHPLPALPAPGGTPARGFADILAAQAQGGTFGFGEIGVFGLGRPTAAPASAASANPVATREVQAAALLPIERAPVAAPNQARGGGDARPVPLPTSDAAAPARDKPAVQPQRTPLAVAVPSANRSSAPEDEEPLAPPSPVRRGRERTAAPKPGISLILAETDGGVEIVAGGPQLDPAAQAALRRLARAILARNGLSLGQFQLNGAPLAADSLDMIGGSHGTRSH